MYKNLDEITIDEWKELCNSNYLMDIARKINSYKGAVRKKLNELGLNPIKYIHSTETKELRTKSRLKFYQDNPEKLAERQNQMANLGKSNLGKTWEEIYGAEKAALNYKRATTLRGSYETIYGKDRAEEIKLKKSISGIGRIHTPESIEKMSQTRKEKMASGEIKLSPRAGCGLGGHREDIGHYVRSSYEHYFAKELQKRNIVYKYEPESFRIIVDGVNTIYTPDFLIDDIYYELKNSYNITVEKFTKRLAAFKEQYPDKSIIVIVGSRIETDYAGIVDRYIKG